MNVTRAFGVLRTLERVTRPAGHDLDRPVADDGEPSLTYGDEPGLSDDELAAVRGLIQERYGDAQRERVEKLERDIFSSPPPWGVNPGDESAPHSQAVASPAGVASPPDSAPAGHFPDTLDLLWLNSEIHALYTHADNEARQSSISNGAYAYWNGRRQALKDVAAQIDTLPSRAPHRNK